MSGDVHPPLPTAPLWGCALSINHLFLPVTFLTLKREHPHPFFPALFRSFLPKGATQHVNPFLFGIFKYPPFSPSLPLKIACISLKSVSTPLLIYLLPFPLRLLNILPLLPPLLCSPSTPIEKMSRIHFPFPLPTDLFFFFPFLRIRNSIFPSPLIASRASFLPMLASSPRTQCTPS